MNQDEFLSLTKKDKLGCFIWLGKTQGSTYGCLYINAKRVYAHRFSYELFKGPIGKGLVIDHLCHNRLCVNPDHLEAITPEENNIRADHTKK